MVRFPVVVPTVAFQWAGRGATSAAFAQSVQTTGGEVAYRQLRTGEV